MGDEVKEETHWGLGGHSPQAGLHSFQHPFTHFSDSMTRLRPPWVETMFPLRKRPIATGSHMAILASPELGKAVKAFFSPTEEHYLGRGEVPVSSLLGMGMPGAGMWAPPGAFQAQVRS